MYCIKCGVQLSEGQKSCPICNTKVYHPDFINDNIDSTYPTGEFKSEEFNRKGILFVITIFVLLTSVLCTVFDISISGKIFWSGFVSGGLILTYVTLILPLWFKKANPVIFVPSSFAVAISYLLYINLVTGGNWFLTLAFPAALSFCIILTTLITLLKYIKKGKLYIFGSFMIALGIWCSLLELFIHITFDGLDLVYWSIYPLMTLTVIGLMLIVIAIVKPLKESLRKMFFI